MSKMEKAQPSKKNLGFKGEIIIFWDELWKKTEHVSGDAYVPKWYPTL
jgi:hypothetical protein